MHLDKCNVHVLLCAPKQLCAIKAAYHHEAHELCHEIQFERALTTENKHAHTESIHILAKSVGSALGCWVKEGWDWLFIFLQDALLK